MNIVVLDGKVLGDKAEFHPLEADKYGWQQYPQLEGDDITERCWRSDIVVTLATPLLATDLDKMAKLKLVITGGPGVGQEMQSPRVALRARGNAGVAAVVKSAEGAIGYVELGTAKKGGVGGRMA